MSEHKISASSRKTDTFSIRNEVIECDEYVETCSCGEFVAWSMWGEEVECARTEAEAKKFVKEIIQRHLEAVDV